MIHCEVFCPWCGMVYKLGRDPYSHDEDRLIPASREKCDEEGTRHQLWDCTGCNRRFERWDNPDWKRPKHNILGMTPGYPWK